MLDMCNLQYRCWLISNRGAITVGAFLHFHPKIIPTPLVCAILYCYPPYVIALHSLVHLKSRVRKKLACEKVTNPCLRHVRLVDLIFRVGYCLQTITPCLREDWYLLGYTFGSLSMNFEAREFGCVLWNGRRSLKGHGIGQIVKRLILSKSLFRFQLCPNWILTELVLDASKVLMVCPSKEKKIFIWAHGIRSYHTHTILKGKNVCPEINSWLQMT